MELPLVESFTNLYLIIHYLIHLKPVINENFRYLHNHLAPTTPRKRKQITKEKRKKKPGIFFARTKNNQAKRGC